MWNRPDSLVLRYGCAVVAITLATGVRLLLDPVLGDKFIFNTMFFAVMVAAWYGGFGPAAAATVLGALAAARFLLAPRGSFAIEGFDNQVGTALFLTVSFGISLFGGSMRRAQRRAEEIAQELLWKQQQVEQGSQDRLAAQERERLLLGEASTANAKFRAFFEQGPLFAGIMALDGTILEPNRLALEACGYTRDQVVGKLFWECPWWNRSPDLVAQIKEASAQAAAGRTFRAELPYFVADGSQRMVDFILLPIKNESGRVLFLAPTGNDITHRRQLEDDLRKSAADLSEADRRKNEFLAVLAHELRNPLAPITNALELMRITGDRQDEAGPLRDMMERQVQQMVHLIDDLLDVSRITSGKIVLRKERLDLLEVVGSALEASRPLVEAAKHDLIVTPSSETLHVEGDKTRLAQVLSNLLANAAKYTPEGGRIWLSVSREGQQSVVRVRDTGLGIPREMLPMIFEMFTQVDRNLGRAQGGLGIGLALVRNLVELHGGTVEAHSDGPGQGSEFVVRLPLSSNEQPRQPTNGAQSVKPPIGVPSGKLRILVVDDNLDAARTLQTLLKLMGNDVRTAADGQSALEVATSFCPNVVFLDIGMPGMNGHEVAQRMRQMPEVKDAVLVAQTGWGQDQDKRKSEEAGFDAHLVKPIDAGQLRKLLEKLPVRQG